MADKAKAEDLIEDDGVQVFRSALEGVQFAGNGYEKIARSAAKWGYGAVQISSFDLDPKKLVEEGGLAETVLKTIASIKGGDERGPMQLAGYSTHCALASWGFPQHPGVLNFVPADNAPLEKIAGRPEEIRAWMWDNVVQYIPEATAKLGLTGTHSFIPPAVVGDIEGLEFAGALVPSYPFVPCHQVKVLRDGKIVSANLWQEAVQKQAQRLEPFFDLCIEHGIWVGHEMHFDTMSRGIKEYLQTLEMMGDKAKRVYFLGMDTSHAWQGESGLQWIKEGGDRIRSLHIKNMVTYDGEPRITGDPTWTQRGMHFGAFDEGPLDVGLLVNYVAANSNLINNSVHRDAKPIGQIGGKDVYLTFLIGEGEHPLMTQVTVAREYAAGLNKIAQRRYGAGFKVGGTKG